MCGESLVRATLPSQLHYSKKLNSCKATYRLDGNGRTRVAIMQGRIGSHIITATGRKKFISFVNLLGFLQSLSPHFPIAVRL